MAQHPLPLAPADGGKCDQYFVDSPVIANLAELFDSAQHHEAVRLALEKENIESRPVWKPLHLQPVFQSCRVRGGVVSENLFAQGLCLPSGTAMTRDDIERVTGIVRDVFAKTGIGAKKS